MLLSSGILLVNVLCLHIYVIFGRYFYYFIVFVRLIYQSVWEPCGSNNNIRTPKRRFHGSSGSIAEIKNFRGFVPQDDIVHEHLTVRGLGFRIFLLLFPRLEAGNFFGGVFEGGAECT